MMACREEIREMNILCRTAQVMTHAGPLQARLQAMGQQHIAELRQAFVGSCTESEVPFVVRPAARSVVLRRRTAAL